MSIKIVIHIIFVIIALLISCNSENVAPQRIYPQGTIKCLTLANEFTEFEYEFDDYYYDSAFRVNKIVTRWPSSDYVEETSYSYYEDHILAVHMYGYPSVRDNDSTTYFLNVGKIKSIQFTSSNFSRNTLFMYQNETLISRIVTTITLSECSHNIDSFQYNGLNQIINRTTSGQVCDQNQNDARKSIFSYTYDSKQNPFKNHLLVRGTSIVSFGLLIGYGSYIQMNNILSADLNNNVRFEFEYEYNEQGFPVKRISTNNVGERNPIIIYKYY